MGFPGPIQETLSVKPEPQQTQHDHDQLDPTPLATGGSVAAATPWHPAPPEAIGNSAVIQNMQDDNIEAPAMQAEPQAPNHSIDEGSAPVELNLAGDPYAAGPAHHDEILPEIPPDGQTGEGNHLYMHLPIPALNQAPPLSGASVNMANTEWTPQHSSTVPAPGGSDEIAADGEGNSGAQHAQAAVAEVEEFAETLDLAAPFDPSVVQPLGQLHNADPSSEGETDRAIVGTITLPDADNVQQDQVQAEGQIENPTPASNNDAEGQNERNLYFPEKYACIICFEYIGFELIRTAPLCGHTVCRFCLQTHLVHLCLDTEQFPLHCILCPLALDTSFCLEIFSNTPDLYRIVASYISGWHQRYRCHMFATITQARGEESSLWPGSTSEAAMAIVKTCDICFGEISESNHLTNCIHECCTSCFLQYLVILVKEKKKFPPACPICEKEVDLQDCRQLLQPHQELKQDFDLYVTLKQHVQSLAYCANPYCATPFDLEWNETEECSERRQKVFCPLCAKHSCIRCNNVTHEERACEGCMDIDMRTLASSKGWRNCPACGIFIEKLGGCGRIVCLCGHFFNFRTVLPDS